MKRLEVTSQQTVHGLETVEVFTDIDDDDSWDPDFPRPIYYRGFEKGWGWSSHVTNLPVTWEVEILPWEEEV